MTGEPTVRAESVDEPAGIFVLSSILTYMPRGTVLGATLLVAVVADNLEGQAIEIIRREGPQGVTMIPARGLNFPEHITFFGLTYRGLEKVLLALVDETTASRTAERLNEELKLLEPFQGLAFCMPVSGTGGIDIGQVRKALADERSGSKGDDAPSA
jgi:hypothetical protein